MGISISIHFSGLFPPNDLVLIIIYFINYPKVALLMLNAVLFSFPSGTRSNSQDLVNTVPKVILGEHTQLL